MINGPDGKRLSKRHGSVSVDDFRRGRLRARGDHELRRATRLGSGRGDHDHEPRRAGRALLARPGRCERGDVRLRQARLDERRLPARAVSPEYADRLVAFLREQGYDWPEERVRAAAPLVHEKIATLGEFPEYAGFLFRDVEPDPALLEPDVLAAAADALADLSRSTRDDRGRAEGALRAVGVKPSQAFQSIRVAVTGSKVSPGLFESLELLGKEESLARLTRAAAAAAA